jgi:signal transduction histidine kinase
MRTGPHLGIFRYGFVFVAVTAALLLRLALWPLLGPDLPFLFLWPAVMCCAWYGGLGPGLLATLVSALAGRYFVLDPVHSLAPIRPADAVGIFLYLALGTFLSLLVEGFHRARRQVEQHENELHRRAEELSTADRRKNEFLAMLAHELRHPLAPITNALEILRQFAGAEARVVQATEMIDRQARQIQRLVEDLMDISRISRGKVSLRKQPSNLAEIVQRGLEVSRPFLEARNHKVTIKVPAEPIVLDADPARLTQVVVNLLTNAAKYTNEGGHIALTVEQQDGQAILRVKDDGIGITPEMLPRVFDLYAQSERTLGHAQGGLGIGLKLVRTFVEMHGGKVEAFSEGSGRGSEFVVHQPVLELTGQWQPAAPERAAPDCETLDAKSTTLIEPPAQR